MIHLSQNKKIAVVAVLLFFVSFSFIWMFLNNSGTEFATGQTDLMNATHFEDESHGDTATDSEVKAVDEGPIVVIGIAGEVRFANDEFCELLSVDCDDFNGELFFDYISSGDLPGLVSGHTQLVQNGARVEGFGPFRMIKGEKEILVLFNAQPLASDGDRVDEIVLQGKDLTGQVEAMQEENRPILDELYPRVLDKVNFKH